MADVLPVFKVDMSRLNDALRVYVSKSHMTTQEAIRFQSAALGLELNKLWKRIVTPQRIEAEMRAAVASGKGFKRGKASKNLRWNRVYGQTITRKVADEMGVLVFGKRGRGHKTRLGAMNPKERAEFAFRVELRQRIARIGFQAVGWLEAFYKFGNKRQMVQVRRDGESWADASGRSWKQKTSKLGRVLERGEGGRYTVTLVNFANGAAQTEAKYGLTALAVQNRRAELIEHLDKVHNYAAREAGLKVTNG